MRLPTQSHPVMRNTISAHAGAEGVGPQSVCSIACAAAKAACEVAGGGFLCNLAYSACMKLC